MNVFYLKYHNARVVIDDSPTGVILQTLRADSWRDARAQVDDHFFLHRPGHGYFTE